MDVKTMNIEELSWDVKLEDVSSIRVTTVSGVFTLTERNGELQISVEHKLQIAPIAANSIAMNEFVSFRGESFLPPPTRRTP